MQPEFFHQLHFKLHVTEKYYICLNSKIYSCCTCLAATPSENKKIENWVNIKAIYIFIRRKHSYFSDLKMWAMFLGKRWFKNNFLTGNSLIFQNRHNLFSPFCFPRVFFSWKFSAPHKSSDKKLILVWDRSNSQVFRHHKLQKTDKEYNVLIRSVCLFVLHHCYQR